MVVSSVRDLYFSNVVKDLQYLSSEQVQESEKSTKDVENLPSYRTLQDVTGKDVRFDE